MRYFFRLAYNGRNYFGWQEQPDQPSVQTVLTDCLQKLLRQNIKLTGCGRTDTGVHARVYYAHADLKESTALSDKARFLGRLNSFLPSDIVVYDYFEVAPEAHARFDAISRTYKYYVGIQKDPFCSTTVLPMYGQKLNMALMQQAANLLLSTEDFTSFSKLHTQTNNNLCKVSQAVWTEEGHQLVFTITANRFLRNMVRAVVGTLIEVGREKLSVEDFAHIIQQKDRCSAGQSVLAQGLFLHDVQYPYIVNECYKPISNEQ